MANCRSCKKEIYFLKTANKKLIPVNAESMTEEEVYDCQHNRARLYKPGVHISHFSDCPAATNFRRRENNDD